MDSTHARSKLPDFDTSWDYDDPAGTEARFRQMLRVAEKSDDRACHAELLTQIARTRSLQREFDDAHAILDEADAMITDEMARARVRSLLERGRTFNSAGETQSAQRLFVQAWNLARRSGLDGLAVDGA